MNNNSYEIEEIYRPYNFDSKELLRSEGWKDYMVERHHQKLDFMLHQIYINRVCNKKYDKDDYIKLSSKYHLECYLYGRDLQRLKPLLYKYDIIEDNRTYTVADYANGISGECKGYRLTKKYNVRHVRVSVDQDTTLYNSIKRRRAKDLRLQDDVTRWINFHVKDVGIHKEAAIAYVEQWYANAILFPKAVKLKKHQKNKPYIDVIDGKRERYLFAIEAIADGTSFNAKRDGKGKRVHHPIAILWRNLRQFLFIKGQPETQIFNLDVSNSQPHFLVGILKRCFDDGVIPADVEKYINLVSTGTFYKYMTDLLNIPKAEVADFKVQLFANVFYCENEKGFYTKEAQAFMKEFSTVYQIVQQEKYANYKNLAIAMQREESKAIIDGVMTELMHKYKDKYFFSSIHDSILCEADFIEEVKSLMEKHVEAVVGIKPNIKSAEAFNICFPNDVLMM